MDYAKQFQKEGFALIPSFYSEAEVDAVNTEITRRKIERPMHVSVDMLDEPGAQRSSLGLMTPEEIETRHYKINDLYLDMESVRYLALSQKIVPLLKMMLGDTPVLCNSLYMDKGIPNSRTSIRSS